MNKIKFIHCADIHFDTAFSGLPSDKAVLRRDELRMNFSKIITHCIDRKADILLISGDLFDGPQVTDETILFLKESFDRIKNINVFISPGNHDPYMPGSKYEIYNWPENVHIFKENRITKVTLDNLKLNIYGAAFTAPYAEKNLLEDFVCDSDYINIMVMHGDITAPGQTSPYNPILASSVSRSKLDYLALGHKHGFSPPEKSDSTYYSYCGAPEGRGFDELGEKGILYGELYRDSSLGETRLDYEFIPCSSRIYREIPVDLTGCETHEEVISKISDSLMSENDLYKVLLTGSLKDSLLLDLRIIQSRFADKYFLIKFRNRTNTEINFEELSKEPMLKGIFAKRMLVKIEDARKKGDTKEEKLYSDALLAGLRAFEGEVPVCDN